MPTRLLAAAAFVFAAAPLAAQSPTTSYGGRWRLDVAQSRDLPPFYAAVREHTLDVSHDDSTLTVAVTLTDTAAVAQQMRFPYDLRRPIQVTTQVRTPRGPMDVPTTLTAVRRADGGLEIDIGRELNMGGNVLRPRDHESWTLSADGRRLVIDREAEMPGPGGMRTVRAQYVFVRS